MLQNRHTYKLPNDIFIAFFPYFESNIVISFTINHMSIVSNIMPRFLNRN